jgi:hypothetical protein
VPNTDPPRGSWLRGRNSPSGLFRSGAAQLVALGIIGYSITQALTH